MVAPPALREMIERDGFRLKRAPSHRRTRSPRSVNGCPPSIPTWQQCSAIECCSPSSRPRRCSRTSIQHAPVGTPTSWYATRANTPGRSSQRTVRSGRPRSASPRRPSSGVRSTSRHQRWSTIVRVSPPRSLQLPTSADFPPCSTRRPSRRRGATGHTGRSQRSRCPSGGATARPRRPGASVLRWCISRSAPCCRTCRSQLMPTVSRRSAVITRCTGAAHRRTELPPRPTRAASAERTRRTMDRTASRPPRRSGRRVPRWLRHAAGRNRRSSAAGRDAVLLRPTFEQRTRRSPPTGTGGRPDRVAGRSTADVRPSRCTTAGPGGRGTAGPPRPRRRILHGRCLVGRHPHTSATSRRHVTSGV